MSSYRKAEAMEKNIIDTLERYHMLSPGDTVIAGFSGGADSMTLLYVLKKYEKRLGIKLVAAHVNHCLRGEEALRDERFCIETAEKLSVPIEVLRADVPKMAAESHKSFEECGREVRYGFFEETGRKYAGEGNYRVATAHNANDCAETFLFNLSRGTGLKGLTGIPPIRENVIRPLIRTERNDIESYCGEMGIEYVTDSTNSDTAYTRNRVRHLILPELEALNSGALKNMIRCMELLESDEKALENEAEKLYRESFISEDTFGTEPLKQSDKAVSSRTVHRIIKDFTGESPEAVHIDKILEFLSTGGTLQVPSGAYVSVGDGLMKLEKEKKKTEETESFSFPLSEKLSLPGCIFSFKITGRTENPTNLLENCLDYDKINSNFKVRNRRPGDRFRPPGRRVTKSFKTICGEHGIEPEKRSSLVILEDASGEIAWIENIGPSEKYKPGKGTEKLMVICIDRKESQNE